MRSIIGLLVLVCLAGILASLGVGLFHLSRGRGPEDSRKLGRAFTIRITLSIALFLLLLFAWHEGWIAPHALGGGALVPPP